MKRWNFENEESEMNYEEEMLYNQASATVKIIEENVRLRRENKRLMKKVEENEQRVNQQLQQNIQWAGNLLGTILEKEFEKER